MLDTFYCVFSAGVVLTLAIPAVSAGTSATTLKSPLVPMGSAHGHTGHVRFLTAIELPEGFDMKFPPMTSDSTGNLNRNKDSNVKAKIGILNPSKCPPSQPFMLCLGHSSCTLSCCTFVYFRVLYFLVAHFLVAHYLPVNVIVIMLTMLLEQVNFPFLG